MLAWELYPNYDYYIWIDVRFNMTRPDAVQWFIDQLGNNSAAFFKHSERNSIESELITVEDRMLSGDSYLITRYDGEPMRKQVESYLSDTTFIDNILIEAGAFIYSRDIVENKKHNIMKEWFYHNCIWSVQDQLSLPYLLHKFNVNYTIISESIYECKYLK